jgi:sRNA-binding protein
MLEYTTTRYRSLPAIRNGGIVETVEGRHLRGEVPDAVRKDSDGQRCGSDEMRRFETAVLSVGNSYDARRARRVAQALPRRRDLLAVVQTTKRIYRVHRTGIEPMTSSLERYSGGRA